MNLASTIIAIICIAALLFGVVYYIWKTKDKGRPSYMATTKAKPTKEEKAALKQAKKDKKQAKKAK